MNLDDKRRKMLADFKEFRKGNISLGEVIANHFSEQYSYDLDEKVDKFIKWYTENMVKGQCTDIEEYLQPKRMKNFIEKMAVWYELRYPDYEINRLMYCGDSEEKNINEEMFINNPLTHGMINGYGNIWSQWSERVLSGMQWDEFYNAKAFINSLSEEEHYFLLAPKYQDLVCIDRTTHLHLTSKGIVKEAEGFRIYTKYKLEDDELKGMHIKDVVELLKNKDIPLPSNNELEESIKEVEMLVHQKEEMLNCIMYRIIERGEDRIGPRRAFLFAKEFKRNIDIPMMYGVDYSDPGLRMFVNEYIKAGGSKDLECYVGYFSRTNKNEKLDTITIQELIRNLATKYTPEEDELHQRLINVFATQLNHEKLKKEEVQKLRLERKLEKSRKNNN